MESGHQIETRNTAYFRHDYDSEHADMRRLYEQAKIDQWNAATDIDWARPLEGDGGLIADDLVDIRGTKFRDRLSADQRVELNRYVTRWRISTPMHGEHGAMLVCSQLVESVHGQDAKLFQATQVVDEGRHNEVLHRYLALRLDGKTYPLAGRSGATPRPSRTRRASGIAIPRRSRRRAEALSFSGTRPRCRARCRIFL